MANYTNYFTLSAELNAVGLDAPTPTLQEDKEYLQEDLQKELEDILKCIKTLDDYETLVDILESLKDRITLRFLYIFYQALVSVEERVWDAAGMHPPIRKLVEENIDLLLDEYEDFILRLETELVQWSKDTGHFDDDTDYEFLCRRNSIYARYSVLAGEIINGTV